ncbi:MAG: hypothetical protein KGJ49_14230 [Alphaproteobacteria bacterium]|nr:hypothetical protein [Alphaproteobacteria bacterium]
MQLLRSTIAVATIVLLFTPAAYAGDVANFYATLKTLDGIWQGVVTTDSPQSGFDGKTIRVKLRLTSSGHAIVHEMREAGAPETPDHLGDITIFYLDGDHLMAEHFCDADNRPLMEAVPSPDPETIKFDLISINGNLQFGYIHDAAFKVIAPDHHTENWTYIFPGNKSIQVHFDLQRVNP